MNPYICAVIDRRKFVQDCPVIMVRHDGEHVFTQESKIPQGVNKHYYTLDKEREISLTAYVKMKSGL